jgi:hypothetical protein
MNFIKTEATIEDSQKIHAMYIFFAPSDRFLSFVG